MLESLHISNYALIDSVDIRFHNGFNIITGETGAGKSIMLGALSLILGGRADSRIVRSSEKKSVIEAIFQVEGYSELEKYCNDNDIEWDDSRCIMRREILPSGRSRAFINDSPVPLSRLEDVAMRLVDIHSQHQNQLLSQPEFQLRIIDTLAANDERLKTFAVRYTALRDAMRKLKNARERIKRNREDEEYTRFQLEQLDEMNLRDGELEDLEHDRDVLANMAELKSNLYDAMQALQDAPKNILALLDETIDSCNAVETILDADDNIPARLENASVELKDIAETITAIDSNLSADPDELQAIEERIDSIYHLLAKHRVEKVSQLLDLRESLRAKLDELENADNTIADLEKDARRANALARETAAEISKARREAATAFAELLKEKAMPLGMKNLSCEIRVDQADMTATGCDNVLFTFSFNKNQPLLPVAGAASGGEISRLMLCIKAIIADKMQLPSIIFDEVDTGVSGDVANRMGEMMNDIARSIQVITITHLPQVAAKGQHHYKVYKEDDEHSTHTRINTLSDKQRVDELALMLSGDPDDKAARANAKALLRQASASNKPQ